MFSWSWLFGAVAYVVIGYGFNELIKSYMKDMSAKVAEIDERFVDRLFITIDVSSERKKDIMSILLFAIWPIICIAAVLKAEWAYNDIKRHVYAGKEEAP